MVQSKCSQQIIGQATEFGYYRLLPLGAQFIANSAEARSASCRNKKLPLAKYQNRNDCHAGSIVLLRIENQER